MKMRNRQMTFVLLYTVPPHEARPADEDAFEYLSRDGPLDVEWRHASQSLSADARHVEYRGARVFATHASAHSGIWRKILKTALYMRVTMTFRPRGRSCNIRI
jgi:hypothetical protein